LRILATSWVAPVVAPPIADGAVAVEAGRVAWVGRRGDTGMPAAPVTDLGPGVLLPGLVNAHCHLELSHLAGLARRRRGFVDWIEGIIEERDRAGPDAARAATADAISFLESATATVGVGDVSNGLAHLDLLAASSLASVVFYELIAWDPLRAEAAVAEAEGRLRALPADLAARDVTVRLAAHAPYSVSPEVLRALRHRGGPAAIHLAESPAESRYLEDGSGEWAGFLARRGLGQVPFRPPHASPVRYLESLGVLHPGLLAAHCVQVDDADASSLAGAGVSVALCPTSNRNLGVGTAPVTRLLAAGVRLCLGTDSAASGDGLDVAAEMVGVRRAFPDVPAAEIVRMATANGAAALGLHDLGAIAPGKRARLAFAALGAGVREPLEWVVAGEAKITRIEG
jgi:cytosine/adenosine deaminase-related metal-dependent hydrolase